MKRMRSSLYLSRLVPHHKQKTSGFTIVELLIVIVVIAILAVVSIVAYNGVQERARLNKAKADLTSLQKAVMLAREATSKTFGEITGSYFSATGCAAKPAGTDLAALNKASDACWVRYASTLAAISLASGVDVNGLVDPWGRPYFIDENEGEDGNCGKDSLGMYTMPANGSARISEVNTAVPLSGFSGC